MFSLYLLSLKLCRWQFMHFAMISFWFFMVNFLEFSEKHQVFLWPRKSYKIQNSRWAEVPLICCFLLPPDGVPITCKFVTLDVWCVLVSHQSNSCIWTICHWLIAVSVKLHNFYCQDVGWPGDFSCCEHVSHTWLSPDVSNSLYSSENMHWSNACNAYSLTSVIQVLLSVLIISEVIMYCA